MRDKIIEEISDFIQMCEQAYASGCSEDVENAWDKVSVAFGKVIPDFYDGMCGPDSPRGDMRLLDLPLITAKLRIFSAKLEYDAAMEKKEPTRDTVILTAAIDVNTPFNTAIELLVDAAAFTDAEKTELTNKVGELKLIAGSKAEKTEKWEKIRPVLAWLDMKDEKTAVIMLPLISQAMK